MRIQRLAAAACLLLATSVASATTLRYDWVTAGERAGHLTVEVGPDGHRTSEFEFNDRGRGPKLSETYTTRPDGTLQSFEVTGRAYMGAAVAERFGFADGVARWHGANESGEARPTGAAFYLAADGTPEQLAALARALLAAPDNRVALLPGGEARLERLDSVELGDDTAVLYAVTGLAFAPQYLWLDADNELFALAGGWMGLAPAGRAELLPTLRARQEAAQRAYHEALAARLTHTRRGSWCIADAAVLDVDTGRIARNRSVRITDGVIVAVGRGRGPCAGVPRVDAGGRTLLPGLWDMHAHLSPIDGILNVAAGVTAARDMANDHEQLERLITQFDSGAAIGPRVFRAGIIDGKGRFAAPTGRLAGDLDEALGFIDGYARQGYPQIKIYSSIDPEWVPAIAERIHRRGMRLSGHIPSGMLAADAVRAGFDEIQHINMVFLNFLAGPDDDTRTPVRFTLVADGAHAVDLDSDEVQAFIALLRRHGTVVDPTVTIFEEMFTHRPGTVNPAFTAVASHLPPTVQRGLLSGGLELTEENEERYASSYRALLAMVARLHAAGIRLVPGTDTMVGFGLHRELELYVEAGIPNAEVLRLATIGSAEVAGASARVGRIAPGYAAEMVLVDGNPLEDISALRRAALVVRGERLYQPSALYEAVGVTPFTRPAAP